MKPARWPPALAGFHILECFIVTTFYYVDAPCGSGKTSAGIPLRQMGRKILFVQPSIDLINQTVGDLASLTDGVRYRAIHGDSSNAEIADILANAKHTKTGGEILFITHSALMLLPYFHGKQNWHVIVDEIPQADRCSEFSIAKT